MESWKIEVLYTNFCVWTSAVFLFNIVFLLLLWLCSLRQEGERVAVVLDQTILYPQGGGQPFDTGFIEALDGTIKFCVTDVRAKSGNVSSKILTGVYK